MTKASKVISAGAVVLGFTLLSAALSSPRGAARAERAFAGRAYTARGPNAVGDAEVDEAVKPLVDLMFKERKVREVFERHFLFSNLPPEEANAVGATSLHYSKEHAALDAKTVARIFSAGWDYAYQPAVLALRTSPLSDFDESVEQADSEISSARRKILNKRGLTEQDFYALLDWEDAKDRKTLESKLTTLELINADLDRFIDAQTDKAVFDRNLTEMKKSLSVKEVKPAGRTIYAVSLKPIFGVLFLRHNGELKMIGFGDAL